MILRKVCMILVLSFLILSCGNSLKSKDENLAHKTIHAYLTDLKNSVSFDTILKRYFYKPKEIKNNANFPVFFGLNAELGQVMRSTPDSIQIFWNKDIRGVRYLGWAYDSTFCRQNVIIINTKYPDNSRYVSVCFADSGKIYSIAPLYNPKTNKIVWIR